jgi:hypothetical protein
MDVNEKVNKGSKEKKMQFNFSFYPESPKPGTRALKAHESKLLFKVLLFLLTDLHLTLKYGKRFVLHQSQTAHNAFFSRIVDAGVWMRADKHPGGGKDACQTHIQKR